MKKYLSILMIGTLTLFAACSSDDDEKEIYTVTFETDSGIPVPTTQKVEKGSKATVPVTNPGKTGYVFSFWHLSGSTTAYNFQTPVNGDITLHAKWLDEVTAEYWQVTWNLNGGTWPSDDNHATQVVKGGTLAEPSAPTKTGSTFEGWYKEADLTNKATFPYNVSNITENFTLYAKWTGGGIDPPGDKIFTSVSALNSWLASQPANTVETAYKVGLKDLNLDNGNNWADLGDVIKNHDQKFLELNLENCGGTAIPDGYMKVTGAAITYYGLFAGRNNLLSINLPKGLKTIGKYTFAGCANPLSVILHEGLEAIGEKVFYRCNIPLINLPEGLKTIDKDAFRLAKITSITIPESVTDLGISAFDLCESLHTVVINAKLEIIEEDTFRGTSIKTITFPASLKTLKTSAIYHCKLLEEIIMLSVTPPNLTSDFTWAIESGGVSALKKIKVPSGSVDAYKNADNWKNNADMIVLF